MAERPKNIWETGQRVTGTIWSCPRCAARGEQSERRRRVVPVDFVNEARERAEKAEAAARAFGRLLRAFHDEPATGPFPRAAIRDAFAAHPDYAPEPVSPDESETGR